MDKSDLLHKLRLIDEDLLVKDPAKAEERIGELIQELKDEIGGK